jgi:hypothetical protein
MSITALPDPPSRSDPANFPERADAFMAALPQFATEANALQAEVDEAAEAVDSDATAAGLSAQAASQSQTQAGASAGSAATQAGLASAARSDAIDARDLAKSWASKPSGTVDGVLLSAYQYAEQAAAGAGAGLPQYTAAAIPTTNVGDIWVIGVGPMTWSASGSRYVSTQYVPSGVELLYTNSSQLTLAGMTSNNVVINGRVERIDDVVVLNVTGLIVGTVYNIYVCKPTPTTFALEASTVGRARGTDGIWIKSGDPTRTLVGKVYVTTGPAFVMSNSILGVLSWYNRRPKYVSGSLSSGTYANTTVQQISTSLTFLSWGDAPGTMWWQGYGTVGAGNGQFTYLCLDQSPQSEASVIGGGVTAPIGGSCVTVPAEGGHTMQLRGNVSAAANTTISCGYGLIVA